MFYLLFLILFIPNITADCPSGSVSWSSTCYLFMINLENFTQAENSCNNLNGNLASIHDSFANVFVFNKAKSIFSSNFNISIGLSCISGNCSWTDGSPYDYNDFPYSSNLNGCGRMSLSNGYWFIEGCSEKRFYVCEISEMLPTPTPILTTSNNPAPLCPSDEWYYFNETNSCYYWTDSSDWATAEAFCVSQNAHLTSIHSSAEMDFFKFIYNGNIWVGLHADKGPIELNTEWQWTDGSYLDYLPWKGDYNFPYTNSYFQCVQAEQYYIWNINCSSMATGVCKKPSSKIVATTGSPPILKCPAGWTYYKKTNSCYLGPTQNFTQNAAETYCTSVGGHLPSIHDINELKFLVYVTSSTFWIGLYSKDNPVQLNTTWKWTDNTPGYYTPWINGIPSLNNKLCATSAINYNEAYQKYIYGFQNADCSASYISVCKQSPLDTSPTSGPTSITTIQTTTMCDNVFTFSTYFIPLGMMNLTTAEEYCQLCGGHLTSIHSFGELYTIVDKLYQKGPSNTTSPNYWTGLYSTNEGRTWKWNDGSPYDFSYWMSGYPYKGGPSCANLIINWGDYYNPSSYGMANNMNCSTSLYGICKYHF